MPRAIAPAAFQEAQNPAHTEAQNDVAATAAAAQTGTCRLNTRKTPAAMESVPMTSIVSRKTLRGKNMGILLR